MSDMSLSQRFRSVSFQRRFSIVIRWIIALILIFFAIFPILFIVSAALNPSSSLASSRVIPENAGWDNFKILLEGDEAFGCAALSERIPRSSTADASFSSVLKYCTWVGNSIKIASISTILSLSITTLAAYAFSRFRFAGRQTMLKAILLIQVFPNLLALVAIFLIIAQAGDVFKTLEIPGIFSADPSKPIFGLNTHAALIFVYTGGAMGINIWLMKGFLDTIPRDIDESAMVDGANHWQIFTTLILPLLRPILIVVGILSFIGTYGDFVLARVLLKSTDQYTLMVGLQIFTAGQFSQKWGPFAAGALIGAVPIMVIYLLLQDQIVGGLTQGAVKG
jgi:ABC-type maltose transport system permease subunit